jgi:hypothetical protein
MTYFSPRLFSRSALAALAAALALSACGSDKEPAATKDAGTTGSDTATAGDTAAGTDAAAITPKYGKMDCDPIDPGACSLPWPSNLYLAADPATKTGYHLAFGAESLPMNTGDNYTDPDDYAVLDGYSIGSPIMMFWANLDVAASKLPNEVSPAMSVDAGSPVAILQIDKDGKVVKTIPWFADLDLQEVDPAKKLLLLHPTEFLEPGTRYIVAVRGLKDTTGKVYTPSPAFADLVAGNTTGTELQARQARFDDIFAILDGQGWKKAELQLAWDFVTNTPDSVHKRVYSLRDQGYTLVGDKGPELKIISVKENDTTGENDNWWLEIEGTFKVPYWLDNALDATVLPRLKLDAQGLPVQQGWIERPFFVKVPKTAKDGTPHGLIQYGHGLNGHADEVGAGYNRDIAEDHKYIFFACHWTGMSQYDVASILLFINNLDDFGTMPDKLQTGFVEAVLLGRAMRDRFSDLAEVKAKQISINKAELYYSGISQGGIYGAPYIALSKEVQRGHLGVPGNNYSLLLHRSANFEGFFAFIRGNYPDTKDQAIVLSTIQLLWDQADPLTWYRHIEKEPLAGANGKKSIMLVPVKGDFQVAVFTNEIAARSGLGIKHMAGYGKEVFGLTEQPYPYTGSGVVLYDYGNPWPTPGNMHFEDSLGDPHSKPRKEPWHQEQMIHFFRTGEIKDVCGGDGCTPD